MAHHKQLLTLTLTLIIGHQIDAAYWHEWDMFLMPGGIQLFDLINLLLFFPLLLAYAAAVSGSPRARACSYLIGGIGFIIGPIHAGFALAGFQQFHLPVSIALIVGASLCGTILLWATYKAARN